MLLQEFWTNRFWPHCTRNLRESTCVGYESAWRLHVAVFGGETTFICYGEANGTVTMLGNPNSAYAGCTGVWRTADPMPAA
nr:MAG: hypothetical protein [Bacteriophage sp.]